MGFRPKRNKTEMILLFSQESSGASTSPQLGEEEREAGKSATIFGMAGLPDWIYFCSCTSWEEIRRIVTFPTPGCKLTKRWKEH